MKRRFFMGAGTAVLAAGKAFPANDRVRVGVIGVGNRGNLLIDQVPDGAEIVAVSDCFLSRCEEAQSRRSAKWRIFQDYRQLLDRNDIDGVIVSTPDHIRVLCAIHACQAGKDVYAEKPLHTYVAEGRHLVKAVRKYGRVLQVGSQQRSMAMNQRAVQFIHTGGLGKVHTVMGVNYPPPNEYSPLPAEPVPAGLNWDAWLGYTPSRPDNSFVYKSWMSLRDYSGGQMTNWGAHGIDQIQCALGTDRTGPVEFWPVIDGPRSAIGFRYENGVTVYLVMPMGELNAGGMFYGDRKRIDIIRNNFRTDPVQLVKDLPPPAEVQKWRDDVALWQARYHIEDWLKSIRSRKDPIADVEIGHRSVSISHIANITRQLNRRLQWDPMTEQFPDDAEANRYLTRERRPGYELPSL